MFRKKCDVIYGWYLCETPRGFWIFYEMTNVSIDLRKYESHVVAQANLTPSNCFQRSRTTLIEICKIATPKNRVSFKIVVSSKSVHERKKSHKWSICDYSCSRNTNLKQHIESVHEGKKPHKCPICDYRCSTYSILKKHIE